MKLKKKKDHSVDGSVLLRRGDKIIRTDRWREGLVRERGGEGEKGGVGGDWGDVLRVRKLNRKGTELCSTGEWGTEVSHPKALHAR